MKQCKGVRSDGPGRGSIPESDGWAEGRKEAGPEELGEEYSSLRPCGCFCLVAESSDPSGPYGLWLARFLCPWGSPGKNTGVVSHFLLQGIFPTQGSKPHLLHWQVEAIAHPSPLGEGELRCLRLKRLKRVKRPLWLEWAGEGKRSF